MSEEEAHIPPAQNDVAQVYAAINNVSADLAEKGIGKTERNKHQGFDFRGIDAVHCALGPILPQHGLVIVPRVSNRVQEERKTSSGWIMYKVTVDVEYTFVSSRDGSTCKAQFIGEAMDTADKATNKAMSAAYKYMAIQTFCIPTDGQEDADAHSPEPAQQAPQPAQQAPPPAAEVSNVDKEKVEQLKAKHKDKIEAEPSLREWVDNCTQKGFYRDIINYFTERFEQ